MSILDLFQFHTTNKYHAIAVCSTVVAILCITVLVSFLGAYILRWERLTRAIKRERCIVAAKQKKYCRYGEHYERRELQQYHDFEQNSQVLDGAF